jgi:hypothetical protein
MSIIFRLEVVASSFSNASARAAKGVRTILVQGSRCRRAATNLPGDEPWAAPLAWARKRGLANIEEVLRKHGATKGGAVPHLATQLTKSSHQLVSGTEVLRTRGFLGASARRLGSHSCARRSDRHARASRCRQRASDRHTAFSGCRS